jgi:hypothetical protein
MPQLVGHHASAQASLVQDGRCGLAEHMPPDPGEALGAPRVAEVTPGVRRIAEATPAVGEDRAIVAADGADELAEQLARPLRDEGYVVVHNGTVPVGPAGGRGPVGLLGLAALNPAVAP